MIPNVTKGQKMYGLINYLMGPGRSNEHTDMHVVTGSPLIQLMHRTDDEATRERISALVQDLDAPHKAFRDPGDDRPHVWHCSLSLRSTEGDLSDDRWSEIAESFVQDMGFAGDDVKPDCEWVAIRHGHSKNENDHVHIAVNLRRADGTKASTHRDFARSQTVARDLEKRFGLDELNTERARPGYSKAEQDRAQSTDQEAPDRVELSRRVRHAAVMANGEGEFVRRVRASGALIRPRFAKGGMDEVQGYSVALRPPNGEQPVWFSGGKLSKDLRLTQLRQRWDETEQSAHEALDEWRATAKGRPTVHDRETASTQDKQRAASGPSLDKLIRGWERAREHNTSHDWEDTASDFSATFSEWAAHEDDPQTAQHMRQAARSYDGLAGHSTAPRGRAQVPRPALSYAIQLSAMMRDPSGRAARLALMRQMVSTTNAMFDAQKARGDLRRARALNESAQRDFAEVIARESVMVSVPGNRPAASEPAHRPRPNRSTGARSYDPSRFGRTPDNHERER